MVKERKPMERFTRLPEGMADRIERISECNRFFIEIFGLKDKTKLAWKVGQNPPLISQKRSKETDMLLKQIY